MATMKKEKKVKKIAFMHDGKLLTFEVGKSSPYEPSKIVREIRKPSGSGGPFQIIHQDGDVRLGASDALVEEE